MPFTPSHAVVALPFVRSRLVPAAIAIGAMTPDVPLFVRGTPLSYGGTHDLRWIPATVILALVLLVIWRVVLRPGVRELSPRWLAARLPVTWDRTAAASLRETFPPVRSKIALLLASLLIGVISHIVWDAFTHEGRFGSVLVPALAAQWGPLEGYRWVQHASSILGLAILAVWTALWLRRRVTNAPTRVLPAWVRMLWWMTLPAALLIAWVWGLVVLGPLTAEFTVAHLGYRVLPPACAVWGVITLALCVVVQVRRSRTAA